MVDHSKLELYNKTLDGHIQGTLVGNWWEERELRLATEIGRTVQNYHIPKLRSELFFLPPDEIKLDDKNVDVKTADRIFCARKYSEFDNTNSTYGSQRNKTDQFQKMGKREQQLLNQNLQNIKQDLEQQDYQEKQERNQRFFETSSGINYNFKINQNPIGKMIMKDQDNKQITQQTDDPYYVELGRIQRPILSQNIKMNQNQNYINHVPATYFEEKKNQGNFYKSEGQNFKLNNQFLKTFHEYTHKKL